MLLQLLVSSRDAAVGEAESVRVRKKIVVTKWPVSRQMINSLLVPTSFPALVSPPPPEVISVMLSFSDGRTSVLLRPSRKWKADSLSLFCPRESISRARRDIHPAALVHPVSEEKWPSSGLMPSSSAALMAGESKLYITASGVDTGTQSAWQMGPGLLCNSCKADLRVPPAKMTTLQMAALINAAAAA